MRTKLFWSALLAASMAAGCGEEPKKAPPPKPKAAESKPAAPAPQAAAPKADAPAQATAKSAARFDCTQSPCVVTVTVTGDCNISVDRDPLHVVKIKDAELEWNLVGQGYEFIADGIRFANPGNQLHNKRPGANKYQWSDRNTGEKAQFKYDVLVKKTQGAACPVLDPIVVNEP
jgi:hypothetical protein